MVFSVNWIFIKLSDVKMPSSCISYGIKDLMYLKQNTKFLPDRWGLKTSSASQSSLNEIVFRSQERSVKSQSGFFKKWLKLAMRFFPKSERIVFYCCWNTRILPALTRTSICLTQGQTT
jgi:hypothetical protein